MSYLEESHFKRQNAELCLPGTGEKEDGELLFMGAEFQFRVINCSVDGVHGLFQQELFVHGKVHEHCSNCGSIIEKIKVNGRGTYYCPCCQK